MAAAPSSIRRRLLLPTFVGLIALLVLVTAASGFVLYRFVRAQVDGRLDAQIAALSSSLETRPDGRPQLGGAFDGPPFDRREAGWYWQVSAAGRVLRSRSLDGHTLNVSSVRPGRRAEVPAPGDVIGPREERLIARVLVRPSTGDVIVATAPRAAIVGPLRDIASTLAAVLVGFAALLLGGLFMQVRLGLRPLDRLRDDIAAVRTGGRSRVEEIQPAELGPLVGELNGLLAQNERSLEAARRHVSNLAHGLKTPLATLGLMSDAGELGERERSRRLLDDMDHRIRHHLRRARMGALSGSSRRSTALAETVDDLHAIFRRIHPDKRIDVVVDANLSVACDAEDVHEMLGNLVDNACRWSRSSVEIRAAASGLWTVIHVDDDGPGLDPAQADLVLRPGQRLDESVAGFGFGLSITTELSELYGGSLKLAQSGRGGLSTILTLPASAHPGA